MFRVICLLKLHGIPVPMGRTWYLQLLVLTLVIAASSVTSYEPDVDLTTPQIIRRHGYSVEAHTVLTEDGYLLTLHRITGSPHRQKASIVPSTGSRYIRSIVPPTPIITTTAIPTTTASTTTYPPEPQHTAPVFVQHGLLGSSADWIVSGPGKALAYLLADEGYDVWLGNARGNTYSRAHINFSISDYQFWDFTWHEMGYYDLPAAIDHVLNVTMSKSVIYVGHSMGTTMFFAMASSRPEYNEKVLAMISLAPVAYVTHVKSPIRLLAPFANDFGFVFRLLGENEFLPQNKFLRLLAKYGCLLVTTEKRICANIFFLLAGFDAPQFDMSLMPIVLSHTPAGTSTKNIIHYAQEIHSGTFGQYDYGSKWNIHIYNQTKPPEYNLSHITTPIEIHYANNDWLANTKDVEEFYSKLKNGIGKNLVNLSGFNHLDFLFGKDAKSLVYDLVISRIKKLSPLLTSEEDTENDIDYELNLVSQGNDEEIIKSPSEVGEESTKKHIDDTQQNKEAFFIERIREMAKQGSVDLEGLSTRGSLGKLRKSLYHKTKGIMEGFRKSNDEN